MKEIIKYEAMDGTMFDDKTECVRYETDYKMNLDRNLLNLVFFDSDLQPTHLAAGDSNLWYRLEIAYQKSKYVRILDRLDDTFINMIHDDYGIIIPQEKGMYRYNDDLTSPWVSLIKDCTDLADAWDIDRDDVINAISKLV